MCAYIPGKNSRMSAFLSYEKMLVPVFSCVCARAFVCMRERERETEREREACVCVCVCVSVCACVCALLSP